MRNSHSLAAFAFGQISTGSRIMSTNPYLQIKQRNEITFWPQNTTMCILTATTGHDESASPSCSCGKYLSVYLSVCLSYTTKHECKTFNMDFLTREKVAIISCC